jgi:uncharacterized membrane protein
MEEANKLESLKTLTTVVYALQAAGFFVGGITWIVAVVVNYVKRDEAAGTLYESHFRWQIRTFWFGLLWAVIGGLLALVLVGFAILFAAAVWHISPIWKGGLNLNDGKPMPVLRAGSAARRPRIPRSDCGELRLLLFVAGTLRVLVEELLVLGRAVQRGG